MKAEDFFKIKDEPSMLEENPQSADDIDRAFLQQLCWDGQMADDEIPETVEALIKWKNKQCERYALHQMKACVEFCDDIDVYKYPTVEDQVEAFIESQEHE